MIPSRLHKTTKPTQYTIAIVANSCWNIYNFRLSLIRQLQQEGYRVLVISPVDEYIHYLHEIRHIQHIPLKKLASHRKNPIQDIQLYWECYRIYRRHRPDLILHFTIKPNIFGSLAAAKLSIPSIATLTGLGYTFLHQHWINRLVSFLYKKALSGTSRIVFHNPDDLQLFVSKGLATAEKSTVIPGSGVNTNHFRPLPKPETGRFIYLFIGRLLYDKGIVETVAAIREVKKWAKGAECWIVGEMSGKNPTAIPKEKIMEWVQNGDVRYFGKVGDVRSLIKRADVVVLPSYREGMPKALLEAMAMGKPIVTTDVAGCRETVKEGENGYLVAPQKVAPLVRAMLRVYQYSPEDLNALGNASRTLVSEQFSEPHINKAYSTLIGSILQSPSLGRHPNPIPKPDIARIQ